MTKKNRRLIGLAIGMAMLSLAAFLTLRGLSGSVTYFYSPSQLSKAIAKDRLIRLGGLVETGSSRRENGAFVFVVTDASARAEVRFAGDPPDLFRENQGVVAEGRLRADGVFLAERVLAKHDETYMPPEVAKALRARGVWRGPESAGPKSVRP